MPTSPNLRGRSPIPVAVLLVALSWLAGCDLSDPPPAPGPGEGIALGLAYPPADGAPDKAGAPVRVEIYRLGTSDASRFDVHPVLDDPDREPVASTVVHDQPTAVLRLGRVTETTHFRGLVGADSLAGSTTFTVSPDDVSHAVQVALADTAVGDHAVVLYDGIVASGLATGGGDAGVPGVVYPVAISNPEPLVGLDLRFVLPAGSAATGATVLLDPGSRYFRGRGAQAPSPVLEPLAFVTDRLAYRLRLTAGEMDAALPRGNDVLLYLLVQGTTAPGELCVDAASATFLTPTGPRRPDVRGAACGPDQAIPLARVSVDPLAATSYTAGDTVAVAWQVTAGWGESVRVDLRDAAMDTFCTTMAAEAPAAGSLRWVARRSDPPAASYAVRVTDLASAAHADAPTVFTIDQPACALTVTAPAGGETLQADVPHEIRWEATGDCGQTVSIELHRPGQPTLMVAEGVAGDGRHPWLVTGWDGHQPGDGFVLLVRDDQSGQEAVSGEFAITSPCSFPDTLPFPTTLVGETSLRALVVENLADVPVTIDVVDQGGAFRPVEATGLTIAPRSIVLVDVLFSPQAAGPASGTLAVVASASSRFYGEVACVGTAVGTGCFDFAGGDLEGWTISHAWTWEPWSDVVHAADLPFLAVVWDDATSHPSPHGADPPGDGQGSLALVDSGAPPIAGDPGALPITDEDGLRWGVRLSSPALDADPRWQQATGFTVRLLDALDGADDDGSTVQVGLRFTIWDAVEQRERSWQPVPPTTLRQAPWETRSVAFAGEGFPAQWHLRRVSVEVWGLRSAPYPGSFHLDGICPQVPAAASPAGRSD